MIDSHGIGPTVGPSDLLTRVLIVINWEKCSEQTHLPETYSVASFFSDAKRCGYA